MNKKTLSVLTPNYNHSQWIGQSIESVLAQSRSPDEYIILDDGSTDNSVDVIRSFGKSVRLIRNDSNKGVDHSVEILRGMASGDYTYFLGADDYVLPGFFEKSMRLVEDYPLAGICFSNPGIERNGVNEDYILGLGGEGYYSPADIAKFIHDRNTWVASTSSILNRSALSDVGGFLPLLRWHADWFALLAICFRHGACYVPEVLARIRARNDSYCVAGRRDEQKQRCVLKHMQDLLDSPPYTDVAGLFVSSGAMIKQVR